MRTLLLLGLGLVAGLLAIRLTPPGGRRLALWLFAGAWLLFCLFNLRTGLQHGYGLAEEIPIHLVLFGVPVALVFFITRKWSRS